MIAHTEISKNMVYGQYTYGILSSPMVDREYWNHKRVEDGKKLWAVVPIPFKSQPELFPFLIDFRALDKNEKEIVFDRAFRWDRGNDSPYFGALLTSMESPEHVAAHVANRVAIRRPNGSEDALRIYDPFVFRHLHWLLMPEQLDSLLGPIRRWGWREPRGDWRHYARASQSPVVRPLRLTPPQWSTLMRVSEINQSLRSLTRLTPSLNDDEALARYIDELLNQAWSKYGLEDSRDRLLFVDQAIRFHPHIHNHPALHRRLEQARAKVSSYSGACIGLDVDYMKRIAQELDDKELT